MHYRHCKSPFMEAQLANPTLSHPTCARIILVLSFMPMSLISVFLVRNFACISHFPYEHYKTSYK